MDKLWHFLAGMVISVVVGLCINPVMGFCAGGTAGVAKELYDLYYKKTYINIKDIQFTASGACLGLLITVLIKYLWHEISQI